MKNNNRKFFSHALQPGKIRDNFRKSGFTPPPVKPRAFARGAGFTFIELLTVSVILSIVCGAAYALFNNGIKIWERIHREIPEQEVNILFVEFTRDLRNCFNFKDISFSGRENEVSVATIVHSSRMKKVSVGRVRYSFDNDAGVLRRYQADYAHVYMGQNGQTRQFLKNIKSFKFSYYFYDEQKKEYYWENEWQKEGLPLAVRMELEVAYDNQTNRFIKTVGIPTSGRI